MSSLPDFRVRTCNARPVRPDGEYVLYWMIAARRVAYNYGLERALELCAQLRKPLVVLEALRSDYPWACDRFHRFIIDGMADNQTRLEGAGAHYYPYVEPSHGAGKGLVEALGERACAVITDEYPAFFLSRMVQAVAARLEVRVEQVDSNGLLPLRAAPRAFPTARGFRGFLRTSLAPHMNAFPKPHPLRGIRLPWPRSLPPLLQRLKRRWPAASQELLRGDPGSLAALPINHAVGVTGVRGGPMAGGIAIKMFITERLDRYIDERNDPDAGAESGLSPYLHFGHISAHDIFDRLARRESWQDAASAAGTASKAREARETGGEEDEEGQEEGEDGEEDEPREGMWGMRPEAEAFLDQLVTWRELGFNMCSLRDDYDRYESLPNWARATLEKHAADPRPVLYSLEELEQGRTYDPLWNASQMQLVREGRIHNYLRMLWGKKILEWSPSPQAALEVMLELNNKLALDGRDPNSYSGIFWVLGRYDRAWGPERPIFGTVRYMSSKSAARKLRLREYLKKYSP